MAKSRSRRRRKKKKRKSSSSERVNSQTNQNPTSSKSSKSKPSGGANNLLPGMIVCAVLLVFCLLIQTGMKGPAFLVFYAIVWGVLFFGAGVLKSQKAGSAYVILGLITFELLGVGRMIYGASIGMSKFGSMFQGMIFGGLLFLIHLTSAESSGTGSGSGSFYASSFSSYNSCGSSCGGGGCGGGGCGGGCGGCS